MSSPSSRVTTGQFYPAHLDVIPPNKFSDHLKSLKPKKSYRTIEEIVKIAEKVFKFLSSQKDEISSFNLLEKRDALNSLKQIKEELVEECRLADACLVAGVKISQYEEDLKVDTTLGLQLDVKNRLHRVDLAKTFLLYKLKVYKQASEEDEQLIQAMLRESENPVAEACWSLLYDKTSETFTAIKCIDLIDELIKTLSPKNQPALPKTDPKSWSFF